MDKNVFLSLLALDSYNGDADDADVRYRTASLGTAVKLNVAVKQKAISDGFYATAYTWGDKTIISYRGTNFTDLSQKYSDIVNGWSMFDGFGTNSQVADARQFYIAVSGTDFPTETSLLPNMILVGHSLGGGLAGYVGARTGLSIRFCSDCRRGGGTVFADTSECAA